MLDSYQPQEKKIGRPAKEPFDPYKEISESVHRAALDAAFTNVCITSYDDYLERLKEGYALQNIKLGHNKAVKVATFLSNKRRERNIKSPQTAIIESGFTLLAGCTY